tara:strand:- start:1526 stop:1702 length:177 start_codon:yes stop_codon:yes gene_type:complete
MKELTTNQVQDVNGGIVALYWVGVGAFHLARMGISYAARNPKTTIAAGGAVAGWFSEP